MQAYCEALSTRQICAQQCEHTLTDMGFFLMDNLTSTFCFLNVNLNMLLALVTICHYLFSLKMYFHIDHISVDSTAKSILKE